MGWSLTYACNRAAYFLRVFDDLVNVVRAILCAVPRQEHRVDHFDLALIEPEVRYLTAGGAVSDSEPTTGVFRVIL